MTEPLLKQRPELCFLKDDLEELGEKQSGQKNSKIKVQIGTRWVRSRNRMNTSVTRMKGERVEGDRWVRETSRTTWVKTLHFILEWEREAMRGRWARAKLDRICISPRSLWLHGVGQSVGELSEKTEAGLEAGSSWSQLSRLLLKSGWRRLGLDANYRSGRKGQI